MIFFSNLIFSIIYANGLGKIYKKDISLWGYILLCIPIIIIWLIICSTQYNVGTDYSAYMEIFEGQNLDRYEPGFLLILKSFFYFGFKGQIFYLIFYSISFFFLFLIFRDFDNSLKYLWLSIILYICVSNLFNNQLNGLRQAVATYIGTYGFLQYIKKNKYRGLLLIFVASTIHLASLVYLSVFLTPLVRRIQNIKYYLLLALGIVLSLTLNISIFHLFLKYLPTGYANYIIYKHLEHTELSAMALKYILIPFYILSIKKLHFFKLTYRQSLIYKWGIVSFAFKLALLGFPTISRISDFFLILALYPLFCLLRYLVIRAKQQLYIIILFFLFLYFIKTVVFPSNEYYYQSMIGVIF